MQGTRHVREGAGYDANCPPRFEQAAVSTMAQKTIQHYDRNDGDGVPSYPNATLFRAAAMATSVARNGGKRASCSISVYSCEMVAGQRDVVCDLSLRVLLWIRPRIHIGVAATAELFILEIWVGIRVYRRNYKYFR